MMVLMRFGFLLLFLVCGLPACRPSLAEVDRTEFAFGSYVRVKVLANSPSIAESAVESAFAEVHRLDTLWSVFLPGSEISRLNRDRGGIARSETRELVSRALQLCRETHGAFDVTTLPLSRAWGFLDGVYRLPDSADLATALASVGHGQVSVVADSIQLGPSAQLDLGGMAVGAAVDRAVGLLKRAGAEHGLVDAGGDIRVFGSRVWRVGLQNPRGSGVLRVFELKNRAVSTSGDYQKYFEHEGRRYHHLLDPRTGYPADECVSVSVLAPTAFEVDAYATAAFVLGPDSVSGLFASHLEMSAVYLLEEGDSLREVVVGRVE